VVGDQGRDAAGTSGFSLLANVYLHYVFDLWVEAWRKKVARGDVIVVRYADDLVEGFESRAEAQRFLEEFRERLAKFGLELHADKTRLIEFGRFAAQHRAARRGKAGDLYVFGFHPLLWADHSRRSFHRLADYGQEADGGEAESYQG
jgi:Reverse transcriptase (RNA-dependent DNA polymerase)